MPTGLALLRIRDPDFETPVAADYVLSRFPLAAGGRRVVFPA
jgi:hypothetical protein